MPKTKISEFDTNPANNTDINGINIAEGCAPSGINNAIRQLMADLKDQQTGTSGDNFTVGGNLAVTGTSAFTGNVSISGTTNTVGNVNVTGTANLSGNVSMSGSANTIANAVITSGTITGITDIEVADGGTGRSSLTSGAVLVGAGTSQVTLLSGSATNDVIAWDGSAWQSAAISSVGGGGNYILRSYTSPATWTKPANLKAVKVTVIGGGGNGGATTGGPGYAYGGGGGAGGISIYYATAASIPAPQSITAGSGTNSFGALASATGGATPATNSQPGGTGGTGSGGTINITGGTGRNAGWITNSAGYGADSTYGQGGISYVLPTNPVQPTTINGTPGIGYGSGGGGSGRFSPTAGVGGTGAPGIVIIEEFY